MQGSGGRDGESAGEQRWSQRAVFSSPHWDQAGGEPELGLGGPTQQQEVMSRLPSPVPEARCGEWRPAPGAPGFLSPQVNQYIQDQPG